MKPEKIVSMLAITFWIIAFLFAYSAIWINQWGGGYGTPAQTSDLLAWSWWLTLLPAIGVTIVAIFMLTAPPGELNDS